MESNTPQKNAFTSWVESLLLSFLRTVIFIVIMVILSYSFLTKQFPPDFQKMKLHYERSLQVLNLGLSITEKTLSSPDFEKKIQGLQAIPLSKYTEKMPRQEPPDTKMLNENSLAIQIEMMKNEIFILQQKQQELESKIKHLTATSGT